MVQWTAPTRENTSRWLPKELRLSDELRSKFGSLSRTMLTLYQSVLGGLDWGTVVVYTCSASCATAGEGGECAYAPEWCWHQDI